MDAYSVFDLELKKTAENLELVGQSQNIPDEYRLLDSSPTFKYMNLTFMTLDTGLHSSRGTDMKPV